MSTASSARSAATTSRAPPTATHLGLHHLGQHTQADANAQRQQPVLGGAHQLAQHFLHARRQRQHLQRTRHPDPRRIVHDALLSLDKEHQHRLTRLALCRQSQPQPAIRTGPARTSRHSARVGIVAHAALDRHRAEHLVDRGPQRLEPVEHDAHALLHVQAAVHEVCNSRWTGGATSDGVVLALEPFRNAGLPAPISPPRRPDRLHEL